MAVAWTTTAIQQTQRIGADGHLIDYVDVTFTLDDFAASGFIEVPMTGDWQAAATAAITERAQQLADYIGTQG